MVPWTPRSPHHKRRPDWFSSFCWAHSCERHNKTTTTHLTTLRLGQPVWAGARKKHPLSQIHININKHVKHNHYTTGDWRTESNVSRLVSVQTGAILKIYCNIRCKVSSVNILCGTAKHFVTVSCDDAGVRFLVHSVNGCYVINLSWYPILLKFTIYKWKHSRVFANSLYEKLVILTNNCWSYLQI